MMVNGEKNHLKLGQNGGQYMKFPAPPRLMKRQQLLGLVTVAVTIPLVLSACSSSSGSAETSSAATAAASEAATGEAPVAVTLITKDSNNPFFIAMQEGAKADAVAANVDLTIASGAEDGDEAGQITAIENAVANGQAGILITPNGPGVNSAINKAREAGLFVIALDTPPDPADTVDITFATDNITAGDLIGQWAAKKLAGKEAVIAMIDAFDDKLVATDYRRHNGFLQGMGIQVDATVPKFADVADSGDYSGGKYTIACQEPGQAAQDDSRTAMENCLNKNPDINVVYAINEPAAFGAAEAIKAAGKEGEIIVVTIDGGCAAVKALADGSPIKATSQQYPTKMASLGMAAIAQIARGGDKPATTAGLDFYNTGVALVTNEPVEGVDSIDSTEASSICWG
jgi:fructose transport system substrate-binding protein